MKKLLAAIVIFISCQITNADPGTYYNGVDTTKTCADLKRELFKKISNDFHLFYGQIDSFYSRTDLKPAEAPFTGFVIIDRYCSEIPTALDSCMFRYNDRDPNVRSFCFTGGTASAYCKCYAKEHSFPSSWFNDSTLTRTDMHHIFPADSKANNDKSNFPLGYVRPTAITTTYNGTKVGRSDAARNFGYIGAKDTLIAGNNSTFNKVFEPIDEFKGDFARAYLYIATRYDDRINNWKNLDSIGKHAISSTSYTGLEPWILQLCVKWHKLDPPSALERKRNDSVYAIQGNRNPYIDFPSLVEKAFGKDGNSNCIISGVKQNINSFNFSVFPNPANNVLNIDIYKALSADASYEVIDILGRKLIEQKINSNNQFTIDVAKLAKGTYLLNIIDDGNNAIQKFIKE